LHPGYRPVVVEHCAVVKEKSPGLKRCLSVDSINPNVSTTSISHQPSSLSLNDADDFKENDKNVDKNKSNSEYFDTCKLHAEEPEAVIVEVEDEAMEVTEPLTKSVVQKQIPVFKFDSK
jgi:serine/arginine repetitive matrix protein 2